MLLVFAILASLTQLSAPVEGVRITARPSVIYVEQTESGQHLNFDFVLENRTSERLLLSRIGISALDESDKPVFRAFVDEYSRASLELARQPALGAGQSILVYNPFHSFPATIPLRKLRYEFSFRSENGRRRHRSETTVAPVLYATKTELILPLNGRLLVWDGHDYQSHHRRFDYTRPPFSERSNRTNFLRYSYDFVVVNEQGLMHRGDPRNGDEWYPGKPETNDAYYGLGAPIRATGDGRVAVVHDGEPDNRRFDPTQETAYGGNYVIIDHRNREYSWFGHLKQGSIRVKPGQEIRQGDVIAQMGASGDSLFPHLHYELRTGVGTKEVEGLPSYFSNFRRLLGSETIVVGKGHVDTGDIVEQIEPAPRRRR
jgi:murein DD-endopeptidase MepM/ murein hydrolase activator NlpD